MSNTTHEITLSSQAGTRPVKLTADADGFAYDPDSRLVEFTKGNAIVLAVAREEVVSIVRLETEAAPESAPAEVPAGKPASVTPADLAFRRPEREVLGGTGYPPEPRR
jgi:hypothetical protein